jgi:photosystem II stability/assembly factor-like uncharacterized protein
MARSSYAGTGIFKSTDGGETWRNMGLADSHHIGRVVVDPKDPDIVYAAVIGHLYSPNEERGVFKTADGGKTWSKVLYIDDRTGAIDLVMHPKDPQVLYATTWEHDRKAWGHTAYGKGCGLYKTTDAGKTWRRLTKGRPSKIRSAVWWWTFPAPILTWFTPLPIARVTPEAFSAPRMRVRPG